MPSSVAENRKDQRIAFVEAMPRYKNGLFESDDLAEHCCRS